MMEYDVVSSISNAIEKDYLESNRVLKTILNVISTELENGGKVKLVDFGEFEVVHRAERKGYQPFYKREIVIPACNEPVFKPRQSIKRNG